MDFKFKLFGFRFGKEKSSLSLSKSVIPPITDDGAILIDAHSFYQKYLYNINGNIPTSEIDLIRTYREMSLSADVETAIDEIINDMVIVDLEKPPVELIFNNDFQKKLHYSTEFSEKLKNTIQTEFLNILRLLDFQKNCYDIIRRWYIDARLYYLILINEKNTKEGILELRYIDPRCIKKIREIEIEKNKDGIEEIEISKEYYIYNRNGLDNKSQSNISTISISQDIKLTDDSIVSCNSGLLSADNKIILSYLHKAIKPYNNLRAMEDALVIYRITRAPERRIFHIDTSDMPPNRQRQYISDIIREYRNKLVYNPSTGEIRDDRMHTTMLEDFWFPKRGDRSSDVTTLPGGQNLSEIADIEFFQKKLYKSLSVPITRLDSVTSFNLGRAAEISREEVKFAKFITRLRHRFSQLFDELLKKQLTLKNIIKLEDWDKIRELIYYDFLSDSHFAELKETEIFKERMNLLDQCDPYIGKYFSENYIKKSILHQSDEEIEKINIDLNKSSKNQSKDKNERQDIENNENNETEMPDVGKALNLGLDAEPEEIEVKSKKSKDNNKK